MSGHIRLKIPTVYFYFSPGIARVAIDKFMPLPRRAVRVMKSENNENYDFYIRIKRHYGCGSFACTYESRCNGTFLKCSLHD